ncbi:hypothetical protein EG834_01045 [bacterium]|nr:hypothetical protein [bacterium]
MSDRTSRQEQSRAEQLRLKRQQTSRTVVVPTKKEVPEPKRHPVVNPFGRSEAQPSIQQPIKRAAVISSRSTAYSTPLRESVSTPARRKAYHVAANGVETRLPSLPRVHFSWQWISGFMVVVLLTAVVLALTLDVFKINQVQVVGPQRVQSADILAVVQRSTKSIFTIDRQKVLDEIGLAFPELTDTALKVDMSGSIIVTAAERTPVMAWDAGESLFWFDADGVVMTPRGDVGPLMMVRSDSAVPLTKPVAGIHSAVDFANLVLARKLDPLTPADMINNLDPVVMKAAIDLNSQMPSGASLVYDPISGIGWQDPRGWKVFFGLDLSNIAFKQVEYQAIVNALSAKGITPTVISVAHIDFPYYRTK